MDQAELERKSIRSGFPAPTAYFKEEGTTRMGKERSASTWRPEEPFGEIMNAMRAGIESLDTKGGEKKIFF